MAAKSSDSKALLMNLIKGTPLPPHLSKPRTEGIDRKALAEKTTENLKRSPLIAVCLKHECRCNASWQSFGFYARKAEVDVPGQGRAAVTRKLDYIPHDEAVSSVLWQTVKEEVCINCFTGVGSIVAVSEKFN